MGILRKIALKVLKATAFDMTIRHHFTNNKFSLNTYHHKGYWYYGPKREQNTIKVFQAWIKPGDYVLEIGGHIGYFTTFYANLVGCQGRVDVFEPSQKNINYLDKNINFLSPDLREKVTVITKGAGHVNQVMDFYIDPISGQNNSFVKDFEGFLSNRKHSAESRTELIKESVDVITLDGYFQNAAEFPHFVKIDVEGFEWNVIQGFIETIDRSHPSFMIEIQADSENIISFFGNKGYAIYNDKLKLIRDHDEYLIKKSPNIFFKYH